MQIQTVGDQIFALTKEVKLLRKRCRQYEEILREISQQTPTQQGTNLARNALAELELDPALN